VLDDEAYTHTHLMEYLCVLNGRFCQKQMPEYKTVCKNPSADLSETRSSASRLPDCTRAFLALTSSSTLRTEKGYLPTLGGPTPEHHAVKPFCSQSSTAVSMHTPCASACHVAQLQTHQGTAQKVSAHESGLFKPTSYCKSL